MSFTCGLLSVSKYLQPKSQIHVNVYLGLLSLAQISHSVDLYYSPTSNPIITVYVLGA